MRVGVLASGGGTNLQALIDSAGGDYAVALVASDRAQAGALERAGRAGISTDHIGNPRDGAALCSLLADHRLDVLVLAGYLRLVPPEVVAAYPGRIINIHPALLPSFGGKGMYGIHVHRAVIASGVALSGVTVHLVDEEYDRGTTLAQWPVPVRRGDTPELLQARILRVEHLILPEVVRQAARHGKPVALKAAADCFVAGDALSLEFTAAE